MAWYDTFANFYDRSLEKTYLPFRERSFARLALSSGGTVLDLACGTGQNLPFLAPRVGAAGSVVALDLSEGMLAKARSRAEAHNWRWVETHACDLSSRSGEGLAALHLPDGGVDAVVCTLGLSVIPEWQRMLETSFELLRPGGEYLVMDVHAQRWNPMKPFVELLARADLTRDIAGELARHCDGFEQTDFDDASPWTFGGTLFSAHGYRSSL